MVWLIASMILIFLLYITKKRFKGSKIQIIASIFAVEAMVFAIAYMTSRESKYNLICFICLLSKVILDISERFISKRRKV
ncbi:hypothetical protein [Clostridium intestinale]|uniref:hypothetical protein n=1 Tax=Clostridium intestinale TaxID=36845 RepID=UPI0028EB7DD4|nr:hypothetical protein [Clostridium intestinale]